MTQNVIKKKICMVGASGVGKTSLVARFVKNIFRDRFLTTVSVKIDKKVVQVGGTELMLMLWDLVGEDEYIPLSLSYLRGSDGYLLVADGTRRETLDTAFDLQVKIEREIGATPLILLLNKFDLTDEWRLGDGDMARIAESGWNVINTSAKTGLGVEEAFLALAREMLAG